MMRTDWEMTDVKSDPNCAGEAHMAQRGARVWRELELTLLAAWMGAAIWVTAVVAPSAFEVLPTRALAGAVVGRTLSVLNVSGFAIGLLLLIMSFYWSAHRFAWFERTLLAIVALACGVGQWVITARLEQLRALMDRPIDELAADDPLRAQFGTLHGISVLVLGIGMMASLMALALAVWRREN